MYRKRSRASQSREAKNFHPRFEPLEQRMLLSINMTQWSTQDIVYTTTNTSANWYTDTRELKVTFTPPAQSGLSNIVAKGFWDGNNTFKVRFTPTTTGTWTYSTTTDTTITGLTNQTEAGGSQIVVGAALSGEHGFLRVDPAHTNSFVWDDGTRYFMMGQTYYDWLNGAMTNDNWKTSVDSMLTYGFTKVRFNVYANNVPGESNIYADQIPYLGMPTAPDRDQLNIDYWQKLDEMVAYMDAKGLVADLIITTPYGTTGQNNIQFGTDDQNRRFVQYVVNRYSAYDNVVWCVGQEWEKSASKANYPQTKDDYTRLGEIVRYQDPWIAQGSALRPLSIHGLQVWTNPQGLFQFFDTTWPTYAVIQYSPERGYDDQSDNLAIRNNTGHNMPVANDEFLYIGQLTRFEHRGAMWGIATAGGYPGTADIRANPSGTGVSESTGDWAYQPEYEDIKNLTGLFNNKLAYWKMSSQNSLITSGTRAYALADANRDYVLVYKATSGNVTVTLGSGTYNVYAYNPTTGATTTIWTNHSGGSQTITNPNYTHADGYHDYVIYAIRTSIVAPTAPSGLGAMVVSSSQINLAWTDNSNSESAFEIEWALNSEFTSGLMTATVGANITAYQCTGLQSGATHYFRVRATLDGASDSSNSNTASDTPPYVPATPSSLIAMLVSKTQVNLRWTDTSAYETGFEIDRATNSSFTSELVTATVAANVTAYQSSGLTQDTTYYYRIRSTVGGTNDSDNSHTVSATTTIADVTWTGANGSTWSTVATSGNWKNTSDGGSADYFDTANVTFDDTAAKSSISINATNIAPESVTFSNSNKNFAITGTHGIAGAATTVIKQGVGTVVMASANSYGGVTTIEGGTLVLQGVTAAMVPVLENAGADIRGGMLMLDYAGGTSPATLVQQLLTESFHAGAFDIGKFQSSASTIALGLGWIDKTEVSKISVVSTLYGDATLDGVVDFSDLGKVLAHYNQPGVWADGDFNYDGVVNFSDLGKILANYNKSLTSMGLRVASDSAVVEQSAIKTLSAAVDAAMESAESSVSESTSSITLDEAIQPSSETIAGPRGTSGAAMAAAGSRSPIDVAFATQQGRRRVIDGRVAAAVLRDLDLSSKLVDGIATSDGLIGSLSSATGRDWHRNTRKAAFRSVFGT